MRGEVYELDVSAFVTRCDNTDLDFAQDQAPETLGSHVQQLDLPSRLNLRFLCQLNVAFGEDTGQRLTKAI